MNSALRRPWLGSIPVFVGVTACANASALDVRVHELSELTRRAREHGAYRCAPEELAQAEAQLDFARHELREGDQPRAREHLTLAHANASAALRLSTTGECGGPRSYAPENVRGETSSMRAHARAGGVLITTERELRRGSTGEHAAI